MEAYSARCTHVPVFNYSETRSQDLSLRRDLSGGGTGGGGGGGSIYPPNFTLSMIFDLILLHMHN